MLATNFQRHLREETIWHAKTLPKNIFQCQFYKSSRMDLEYADTDANESGQQKIIELRKRRTKKAQFKF